MLSLLSFILALAILIAIHEFGHFWVARRCGVKVLKFSIGFGKPLWQKTGKDGTNYVLAMIPLGGYVKMLDEREGKVAAEQLNQAFNRKPLRARVAIAAAGPIANLLFAIFAYWLVFISGIAGIKAIIDDVAINSPAEIAQLLPGDQIQRVNGDKTPTLASVRNALSQIADKGGVAELTVETAGGQQQRRLEVPQQSLLSNNPRYILKQLGLTPLLYELKPVVGVIVPNKPAQAAGLQAGDLIISTDNQAITHWAEWVEVIRASPNQLLNVEIERQGQRQTVQLRPSETEDNFGVIGAGVDGSATIVPIEWKAELRYGPVSGLVKAVETTWKMSSLTIKSIVGMLAGEVSSKNLGGPISIAQFAGASADRGVLAFISFLAIISISLGILNLLPIPILDGGHLMMYFFEWVRGKPLSEKMQSEAQKIGLILLLTLMFFAFFNDLSRLFGL
jgi:regulator of sigma E protease